MANITSNRKLRQRRWLKPIETVILRTIDKVEKQGMIVVANRGKSVSLATP
jgi:phage terminase Nu1 subunit (DNA packaging protein)